MVLLLQQKYDPVHEKSLRILFGQSFPLQVSNNHQNFLERRPPVR